MRVHEEDVHEMRSLIGAYDGAAGDDGGDEYWGPKGTMAC